MTEAVKALIRHIQAAFPGQLTRLTGKAFAENSASCRLFERCGFVKEGIMRCAVLDRDSQVHDEVIFAYYL